MYFQMVRIEQQKLMRRRIFWIELGLMALAILLVFGSILFFKTQFESGNANNEESNLTIAADSAQEIEAQLLWPSSMTNSLAVAGRLGTFLIIILAGAATAQEYTWRSISLWLSRGVPRPLFLLAKFTAVLISSFILISTAVLFGALISSGFNLSILGTLPFSSLNWGMVGLNLIATLLSLLPYAAFTLFLAVISRSAIVAIGGSLLFVTLIEPLIMQFLPFLGTRWELIVQYFPSGLARSMWLYLPQMDASAPAMVVPEGVLAPQMAVFTIIGIIIVFISLSLFVFQKQDLGG